MKKQLFEIHDPKRAARAPTCVSCALVSASCTAAEARSAAASAADVSLWPVSVAVPRAEALMVDLREAPDVRIERALRPADLEPEVLAYLSPRSSHPWFVGRDAAG